MHAAAVKFDTYNSPMNTAEENLSNSKNHQHLRPYPGYVVTVFLLAGAMLFSGCAIFKKKCDCPKWGATSPGKHNPTAQDDKNHHTAIR